MTNEEVQQNRIRHLREYFRNIIQVYESHPLHDKSEGIYVNIANEAIRKDNLEAQQGE